MSTKQYNKETITEIKSVQIDISNQNIFVIYFSEFELVRKVNKEDNNIIYLFCLILISVILLHNFLVQLSIQSGKPTNNIPASFFFSFLPTCLHLNQNKHRIYFIHYLFLKLNQFN